MPSGIYKRSKKYKEQCKKRAIKEGVVKYLGDGMLGKHHTEATIEKIKKSNKKKKVSEETKRKISKKLKGRKVWNKGKKGLQVAWNKNKPNLNFRGEKNPNWRGGVTPLLNVFYYYSGFRKIRKVIYERDNYTCQKCGKMCEGKEIQCHHIMPVRNGGSNELNNLITLCNKCHTEVEWKIRNPILVLQSSH